MHHFTAIERRLVGEPRTRPLTDSGQANIKLEAYGYAIADATKALEIDPSYIKVSLNTVVAQHRLTCAGILAEGNSKHCHSQLARRPQRLQGCR
jgi:hypothetical protein